MPKIVFLPHSTLCPEGAVVDATEGESILDVALRNGIEIEHACEMSVRVPLVTVSFVKVLTLLMKVQSWKTIC